jgi:L-lactate dehydrogenase complex protein LldG
MKSKQQILDRIRRNTPPTTELPPLVGSGMEFANPTAQFVEVLTAIGGTVVQAKSVDEIESHLQTLEVYQNAGRVLSTIDGVGQPNGAGRESVDLSTIADPKELMGLDVAILPGLLAVAENGAVWTQPGELAHRAAYYLAEHLMLVVPADRVVCNMHLAYRELDFSTPTYGTFIAGPSKTADIEQSLVIGAQGPRSTVVYLLG